MSRLGEILIKTHTFKTMDLDTTNFPMSDSFDFKIYNIRRNDKDKLKNQITDTFDPKTKKIYLKKRTKSQIKKEYSGMPLKEITWIGGITQEMWDFEIGGRKQLKEWLYARRFSENEKLNTINRAISNDELEYFLKVCVIIKKTIEILPDLDEIYKEIDK